MIYGMAKERTPTGWVRLLLLGRTLPHTWTHGVVPGTHDRSQKHKHLTCPFATHIVSAQNYRQYFGIIIGISVIHAIVCSAFEGSTIFLKDPSGPLKLNVWRYLLIGWQTSGLGPLSSEKGFAVDGRRVLRRSLIGTQGVICLKRDILAQYWAH